MLSLFLILKLDYTSVAIWLLQVLCTLLTVCNRPSLFYIFVRQSLCSHHIIIAKVNSELIFAIVEGETGGLSWWLLTLHHHIFLKKRHFVPGAAGEGLAKMNPRIVLGFLPSWGAFSCSLSERVSMSPAWWQIPDTCMWQISCMSWGHKSAPVPLTWTAV